MKEKILAFFKNLIKTWKFWVGVAIGILTIFALFNEWSTTHSGDTLSFIDKVGYVFGGFFGGILCWYLVWWWFKVLYKIFKGTGKVAAGAGKMAVKGAVNLASNSSSSSNSVTNNSQSKSTPQKTVRKVWTMKYVGPEDNRAPGGPINVPSGNQTGRPTTQEVIEALKAIGYSNADANALGGVPDSWWKSV